MIKKTSAEEINPKRTATKKSVAKNPATKTTATRTALTAGTALRPKRVLSPIRKEDAGAALTLDRYQSLAADTDIEGPTDPLVPLLGLGGEIGALTSEYKKKVRHDGTAYVGFEQVVRTEIGDILWYLAALARRYDFSLSDIAHSNLQKTRRRWTASDGPPEIPFDEGFPPKQRLPRKFEATFTTETTESGIVKCNLRIDSEEFGDPIDDNARHEDDYRFHDIFHIAHAAVLGWSPVLRSLIKRKRKFQPEIDRVEDSARAIAVEEAITAMVFELAKPWNYFAGSTKVDDAILTVVQAVAARLEGGSLPGGEWERAILAGYEMWGHLRANDGGRVIVDLDKTSLKYARLKRSARRA